jgi:23S rRNA pseudouridine2605 synthase
MKHRSDKKPPHTPEIKPSLSEGTRLNKYISNCGICSRRDADVLIQEGRVKVNGKTVTELGYKLNKSDEVRVNNKIIRPQNYIYILLNKPKGFLSTTSDPQERDTVMQLVEKATKGERVYPVGRLDKNTTGLLLLTNDGELTHSLIHPSQGVDKIYAVTLNKPLTKNDFLKIVEGVELEDGVVVLDEIAYVDEKDKSKIGIKIHSGRNRVIRRLFEALKYDVEKLDRVVFGILTKKDLPRGKWRYLSPKEVQIMRSKLLGKKSRGKT